MKRTRSLLPSLLLLLSSLFSYSQVNDAGIPLSISEKITKKPALVEVNSKKIDLLSFRQKNRQNELNGLKKFLFAECFNVNLSPENAGEWEETESGKIWRLAIRSASAHSIYLTFRNFQLIEGAKLFVYHPAYTQVRGAFSNKNNYASRLFSVAPIKGDVAVIELNLPRGTKEYGSLEITKVYHDVLNVFGNRQVSDALRNNGTCDENINCENGTYWQTEKRSVCKIITDGALSTGTLVANTSKNQEPYLLTSYHSMFSNEHAAQSLFIFNYEYPDCESTALNDTETISGASLLASAEGMDFSLLRLNEIPPASYRPFYAGWDVRDVNAKGGICIHHPAGKHKQIAIDYHSLSSSRFDDSYLENSAWKVESWDIGSTEPGSSGSPLFNPEHRLVGALSGGFSGCNKKGSDYFNKLSISWDRVSSNANQLKAWLDPADTGLTILDGYDPYGFNEQNCSNSWNIAAYETPGLISSGLSRGYLSGHNSLGYTQFAERYVSPGQLLIPGIYLNVAKVEGQPLSTIRIKVWEGSSAPVNELYSQSVFFKDLKEGMVNYLGFDSPVKVSGNFFIGYEISYGNPDDLFAVYQVTRSGRSAPSSMYVFNGTWNNSSNLAGNSNGALAIGILQCYGRVYEPEFSSLYLYPNPSTNFLNIEIPYGIAVDEVSCFNLAGQKVEVRFEPSELTNRLYFDLPPGLYVLRLKGSNRQFISKFVVQPYQY